MSKYKIIGDLDYVAGHLRYGHYELTIDKERWDCMNIEEQEETLRFEGDLIIDDYSVEHTGDIYDVTVVNYKGGK